MPNSLFSDIVGAGASPVSSPAAPADFGDFNDLVHGPSFKAASGSSDGSALAPQNAVQAPAAASPIQSAWDAFSDDNIKKAASNIWEGLSDKNIETGIPQIPGQLAKAGLNAASGVAGIGGGALTAMNQPALADQAFGAVDYFHDLAGKQGSDTDTGFAKAVGGLPVGLATLGMPEQFNAGADVLREGGTLGQAEAASAKQGAVNAASLGLGAAGSQEAGIGGYLSRAGVQVPGSMAVQAADDVLSGRPVTTEDMAQAAGMGLAFAGMHSAHEVAKTASDNAYKAATDSGATPTEATKASLDAIQQAGEISNIAFKNGDFDSVQQIPSFGDTTLRSEVPTRNEAVDTSQGFGDEAAVDGRQPLRTDVQLPEQQANAVSTDLFSDIVQPEGEQAPSNTSGRPLEASQSPSQGEEVGRVGVDERTPQNTVQEPTEGAVRNSALSSAAPDGTPVLRKTAAIPRSISDALDSGSLTGQHVLDSIVNNHDNLFTKAPEAQAFVRELKAVGDKLGGLQTKIEIYDPNNPLHKDAALRNRNFKQAAALYDPVHNQILLNKDVTMATMVHEVGHAVTEKALSLGEDGKLTGKAQEAYMDFRNLFETLTPHLDDKAKGNALDANMQGKPEADIKRTLHAQTYGLSDPHEFMSEMFSNPVFRNHLKSLSLDEAQVRGLGLGRLAVAKVRNAYQAVTGLLSKMLGLSPKAENSLDAMFSSAHNFLHSFDDKTAGDIRASNSRVGKVEAPDMSFLGEQAPSRFSKVEPSEEEQPRQLFNRTYGKAGNPAEAKTSSNVLPVESAPAVSPEIAAQVEKEIPPSASDASAMRSEAIPNDTIGSTKASIAKERSAKSMDQLESTAKQQWPETYDKAMKLLGDDKDGSALVDSILKNESGPITADEVMALTVDKQRITNAHNETIVAVNDALDRGLSAKTPEDKIAAAKEEAIQRGKAADLIQQLDRNHRATQRSSSEIGRALQALQAFVKPDYSLEAMMQRARAARGKDVTPEVAKQVADIQKQLADVTAKLEAATAASRNSQRKSVPRDQRTKVEVKFHNLSERLKAVRAKDQLEPGCVV